MLDIQEAPEPINFEVEPGELRDYEGKFPKNDPEFTIQMPPVERETWMALIIRIFGATGQFTNFHDFFYELVHRGALEPESIDNFLNLETLSEKEFELFNKAFKGKSARVAEVISRVDGAVGHQAELDPSLAMEKIRNEIKQSALDFANRSTRKNIQEDEFPKHRKIFNNMKATFVGF